METITANLNNAECIKGIENFGHTVFVNICSGAENVVPWGAVVWSVAIIFAILFVGLGVVLVQTARD